jgi:transposase
MNELYYIGVDLHKRYSYVTVIDQSGSIIHRKRLENDESEIQSYFEQWSKGSKVAIEATYNWYWLVDLLEQMGFEVSLSHPYKTKIIGEAKIKTDTIDSATLAQLLRVDFLPKSYIASPQTRDQREWLRHRLFLVKIRTSIKARIHCVLDKYNYRFDTSDIFGASSATVFSDIKLPADTRKVLDNLLVNLDFFDQQVKMMDKKIKKLVPMNHNAQLLMTIPGIGWLGALLIVHEIGDFSRFAKVGKFLAYTGLIPGVESSGDKTRLGRITKQGNKYLRWYLVQAASAVISSGKDNRLMRLYKRITAKRGYNIAKIAVARELMSIVYFLIKKKEPYDAYHVMKQVKKYQAISL